MASFLQMMFSCQLFRHELISKDASNPLVRQLQRLFGLMEFTQQSRTFINPALFRQTLPSFFKDSFEQHDCSEFAKILLDKIEQETKSDVNLTGKHFEGKLATKIVCETC